jgi:hypothetical protein
MGCEKKRTFYNHKYSRKGLFECNPYDANVKYIAEETEDQILFGILMKHYDRISRPNFEIVWEKVTDSKTCFILWMLFDNFTPFWDIRSNMWSLICRNDN